METSKRMPAEKAKWLDEQLKEIKRTRALLDRFERLTQKWLKKLQAR